MPADKALIEKKATESDVAIITIGRNSGEFQDRNLDNDFNMSATEIELIKNVSTAFHAKGKKLIVLVNTGGVIETASWRDYADAIVIAWQGGQESGNAVADVLSGKVNPSGKLATSFPMAYSDVPSAKNFPGKQISNEVEMLIGGLQKGSKSEVIYEEGIYVGYRYYNTFNVKPAFEFGFGLSYTNFIYSNLKLSSNTFTDKITASVTITNTGKTAGKEVVELYISAPSKKLDKPTEELKGFAKTKLLQPNESQIVTFTIDARSLASYDTKAAAWVAEAGKYTAKVGKSSMLIQQSSNFNLTKDITVQQLTNLLVPQVNINEIKH